MTQAAITVLIPLLGDARHLITAVCSAAQRQGVNEVLILDDGSLPHTLNECVRLSQAFSNVKLYRCPRNRQELSSLLNFGIKQANGEYVAFLIPDGYYLPGRFNKSLEVLGQQPEVDGIYVDVARRYQGQPQIQDELTSLPPSSAGSDLFDVLVGSHLDKVDISGLLLRKSALIRSDCFMEGIPEEGGLNATLIRLSILCNLRSTTIGHALAVRCLTQARSQNSTPLIFARLIYWSEQQKIASYYRSRLLAGYLHAFPKSNKGRQTQVAFLANLLRAAARWPSVMRLKVFWRCFGQTTKAVVGSLRPASEH